MAGAQTQLIMGNQSPSDCRVLAPRESQKVTLHLATRLLGFFATFVVIENVANPDDVKVRSQMHHIVTHASRSRESWLCHVV